MYHYPNGCFPEEYTFPPRSVFLSTKVPSLVATLKAKLPARSLVLIHTQARANNLASEIYIQVPILLGSLNVACGHASCDTGLFNLDPSVTGIICNEDETLAFSHRVLRL